MFNVFFHDKATEKAKNAELVKKKNLKSISAQIRFRDELVSNNKIRVKQRVINMSLDPVAINRHEISMKLPEFKGESFIRYRPKDSKQRVKDAEVKNNWLDTVPLLLPPHEFRSRLKEKEINLDMKYKPKDRYERVADTWQSQRQILDNSWEVKQSESISKRYFPNTLRRSYYKTVESLALDYNPQGKKRDFSMVNSFEAEEIVRNERKLVDVAREVMEKCKLKPLKEELRSVYTGITLSDTEGKVLVKKIPG